MCRDEGGKNISYDVRPVSLLHTTRREEEELQVRFLEEGDWLPGGAVESSSE